GATRACRTPPHPSRRAHARPDLRHLYRTRAPLDEDGRARSELRRVAEPLRVIPSHDVKHPTPTARPLTAARDTPSRCRATHAFARHVPHRGLAPLSITSVCSQHINSYRSREQSYLHIRRAVSHTLSSLRLSSSMERSFPTIEEAKPH